MQTSPKRFRLFQKTCRFRKLQKEIRKAKEKSTELTSTQINNFLKCTPNFLGCYPENHLKSLTINSFPCFLIVNIDRDDMPGSHWISLGLFRDKIEIVDPLGFSIFNWKRVPCGLMNFCHRFAVSRKILISKRIQPKDSTLCGFYSIYYVLFRQHFAFYTVFKDFLRSLGENDTKLINKFK